MDKNFNLQSAIDSTLKDVVGLTPDFVGIADPNMCVRYINKAGRQLIGLDEDDNLEKYKILDIHPRHLHGEITNEILPFCITNGVWSGTTQLKNMLTNDIIPVSAVVIAHYREDDIAKVNYISTILRDVRPSIERNKKLELLSSFPAQSPFPILRIDSEFKLNYANKASHEVINFWGICENDSIPEPLKQVAIKSFNTKSVQKVEILIDDNVFLFNISPEPRNQYLNIYAIDINEQKKHEEKLKFLSHHDELTELPNRQLLEETYNQTLKRSTRKNEPFSLLFIDLDNFKYINDNYGHVIGDKFLKTVAKVFINSLRESDFISRISGDEFIIILNDTASKQGVISVINKIKHNFKNISIPNVDTNSVTLSIGVYCHHPKDKTKFTDALRLADKAMYQAKNHGKDGFQFHN